MNQQYWGGAGVAVSDTQFGGAAMPARIRKPYHSRRMRQAWTEEEHCRFVEAVSLYKRDWKKIEEHVKTKDILQIRSHAQKYFMKVKKQSTGEYVPPPRPKKKAAHPYPRQRVQAPDQVYSKPQHPRYIHSHVSSMSSRQSGTSSSPSLESMWVHQTAPHGHWEMPVHRSMYWAEDMYSYSPPVYEYPQAPSGMHMWRTQHPCHGQACGYSRGRDYYCMGEERSHHAYAEAALMAKRFRSIRRDKLNAARRRLQEEKMDDEAIDESGSESGSVEVATGSSITKDSSSEEESDLNSSVNE